MQTTGKFRNKKATFTAASNVMLFDARLDMDTKTLHNMINYYISIPGFTLYKGHLQKVTGLGQKAFNRMWKQLKETGYLVQHKLKGERGIFYYEYELFDVPQIDETVDSDKQVPDKQDEEGAAENMLAYENEHQVRKQQQASLTKTSQTKGSRQAQPVALKAPLEEAALGETVNAQRGDFINKTLENKTINNNTLSNQKNKQQQDLVVMSFNGHLLALDREIIAAYQRAFTVKPAPQVREALIVLLRRFEKTVLLYAIETAGSKGKGFDYAQGILRKLEAYEAYTMDAVFEYEERYSACKIS